MSTETTSFHGGGDTKTECGPAGYTVSIDEQAYTLPNPAPTGNELLAQVGRDPAHFFLTFKIAGKPDEVVELDEPFDLTAPGTEEFILVTRDRHFNIQVNETTYRVIGPFITGKQILALESKDPATHFVTQILPGVDDIVVGADDRVDLSKPGVERFTIVAKPCDPHIWKIDIDGQVYDWRKDTITTEELIQLGHLNAGEGVIVIDAANNERTLAPGETVQLADGICFGRKVRFRRG
jgi:hypothetical protein